MAAKQFRYKHYSTSEANRVPNPSNLNTGEIALNVAKDSEKMFIKNSDDEIVSFIPEEQISTKINSAITTSELIQSLVESVKQLRIDLNTLSIAIAEDLNELSDNVDTLAASVVEDIDELNNNVDTLASSVIEDIDDLYNKIGE